MGPALAQSESRERRPRSWPWALLIAAASAVAFGFDLSSGPRFIDESAYLSQTYFADLLIDGDWDSPLWLDYASIDLPPLPKYLFGLSLRLAGRPRFGPAMARGWYANPGRFVVGAAEDLLLARGMVVPLGVLGCVSTFAIGSMSGGRRVGALAATLLMIDPLYRVHSRRAMADVPAESLILAASAIGLLGWRVALSGPVSQARRIGLGCAIGGLAGLAVLAKLSGGLALMTFGAQTLLGLLLPGIGIGKKLGLLAQLAIAASASALTFFAFNPMLWSHPRAALPEGSAEVARMSSIGRAILLMKFRADVSRSAMKNPNFRKDVLESPADKVAAVIVQGFGRFGPIGPRVLDSSLRFDPVRDRGAWVWGPLVGIGVLWSVVRGARQRATGGPPTSWAVLVQFLVTFATVSAFIPLAWDRYMLPIQSVSALLASGAIVAGFDGLVRALHRPVRAVGGP